MYQEKNVGEVPTLHLYFGTSVIYLNLYLPHMCTQLIFHGWVTPMHTNKTGRLKTSYP